RMQRRADKDAWSKQTVRIVEAVKVPGEYAATAVAAVAVGLLHRQRWRGAALVAGAGAISGINSVLKWVAGRRRPIATLDSVDHDPTRFQPFVGGLDGLLGSEKNLCFPSGHACLAFATATALAMLLPRWRWAFYAVANAVAAERVWENAHYPSDTVAGAALGVLAALAARALLNRWWPAREGASGGLDVVPVGEPAPVRK
ncbi:MAG TPA: phosphatase PAP2 family protein, partial [Humisphaera sp.]